MSNARFQSNGVDILIDSLMATGEAPGNVREQLWAAVWARGHQDVMVPLPMPDSKIEGFVIMAYPVSEKRSVVAVDTGEYLVGLVDEFPAVTPGAKVRLQPLYGNSSQWSMKVLAQLGCGLQIRFDDHERTETMWADRLRHCLAVIREGEVAVRRGIEQERRRIEFVSPPTEFRVEMEAADKELRERVLAGGYTEEEKRMLAKAKTQEAMQKVVAVRNKRLVDAYRAEVVKFRAQIPALRAEWDRKVEAYAEFRKKVDRCNEVDAASRTVTEASLKAAEMLSTVETGVLNVKAVDLDRIEREPRKHLNEIVATIELLYELLPKRLQRAASTTTAAG